MILWNLVHVSINCIVLLIFVFICLFTKWSPNLRNGEKCARRELIVFESLECNAECIHGLYLRSRNVLQPQFRYEIEQLFFLQKKRKQIWEVHNESRDFFNHCNFEVCAMQQMKKHRRALLVSSLSYLYDDAAVNARKTHTKQSGGLGKKTGYHHKNIPREMQFCVLFFSLSHTFAAHQQIGMD